MNSQTTFISDGVQTAFPLSGVKAALDASDVTVLDSLSNPVIGWTYLNNTLTFAAPPSVGVYTVIRSTDTDVKVAFASGQVAAADIALAYKHALLLAEEIRDSVSTTNQRIDSLAAGPEGALLPSPSGPGQFLTTGPASPYPATWTPLANARALLGLTAATTLKDPASAPLSSASGHAIVTTSGGEYRIVTAAALGSLLGLTPTASTTMHSSVLTAAANATNGASGLVALDSSSRLPAVDGRQVTNIRPLVRQVIMRRRTAAGQATGNGIAPTITGSSGYGVFMGTWNVLPPGAAGACTLTTHNIAADWGGTLPTLRQVGNVVSLPKGRYRVRGRHRFAAGVASFASGGGRDQMFVETRVMTRGYDDAALTAGAESETDVPESYAQAAVPLTSVTTTGRATGFTEYECIVEYSGTKPWFGLYVQYRVSAQRAAGSSMSGLDCTGMFSNVWDSGTNNNTSPAGTVSYEHDVLSIERID
jgi:hypothetical protein